MILTTQLLIRRYHTISPFTPVICLTQAQHHMRGAELLSGTIPLAPNESASFTFCCNIRHHDCYFNSNTVTLDRNSIPLLLLTQCAAVFMPNLSFTQAPISMRWATFAPFQVSKSGRWSISKSFSERRCCRRFLCLYFRNMWIGVCLYVVGFCGLWLGM